MMSVRRLDQWLANLGYGSRREVRQWIEAGQVTVDGVVALRPDVVVRAEQVRLMGRELDHPAGLWVMLHKPVGVVCSHNAAEGERVYDLLPEAWLMRNPKITSVGRLDAETSGLLLLTDQGGWVQRLTSPRHHVKKVYVAELDADLPAHLAQVFAAGTLLLRGEKTPCLPAELEPLDERRARLTLWEGRYHQVRRMFASQGLHVVKLHREQVGPWTLGDLAAGEWRSLPLPDDLTFSSTEEIKPHPECSPPRSTS